MRDCLELLGDIIAIHLFSPGEISFTYPFNVEVTSVNASSIILDAQSIDIPSLVGKEGIAVDTYYNTIPEDSIIMEQNASIKESVKTTTAGQCYSTKISIKTYDTISDVRSFVRKYSSQEYFDAIIVDSYYRAFLLRGVEPATSIGMSSALPVTNLQGIDIEVVSVNGLLPIVYNVS